MPLVPGAAAAEFLRDERHGPLPAIRLVLTVVTGVVDAVSIPDLTTTVLTLTLTLTGIAADSPLAGGANPNPRRR